MRTLNSGHLIVVALVLAVVTAIAILTVDPVTTMVASPGVIAANPMPLIRPGDGAASPLPVLSPRMPEFVGITGWLNSPAPLTPEDLKGKVTLVDFWTYSCINCIRTQPVLRAWYEAYKDEGFEIVGVHTPEFAFEKSPSNVEAAVRRAGLEYPIALDPDYGTWNAYSNRYWPAGYLFDRQGRLRYVHFGEGEYERSEAAIRELLAEDGEGLPPATGADTTPDFASIGTAETYFGHLRAERFVNAGGIVRDTVADYTLAETDDDFWSVGGSWRIEGEKAVALSAGCRFRMNMEANAMHLVLGSANGAPVEVRVRLVGETLDDGEMTSDTYKTQDGGHAIAVGRKDLYRIVRFADGGRHTVELEVSGPGVEFYAATFGE